MMKKISLESYKGVLERNYILLLTSNEKEKAALNKVVENISSCDLGIPNRGCYIGTIKGAFVLHISGTSGVSLPDSIARVAMNFVGVGRYPSPCFSVLIGFCWGNPLKVKIGQTLICTTIYSINKTVSTPAGVKYNATILNSSLLLDLEGLERCLPECSNFNVSPLVSLEMLLTSTSERDNIVSQFPSAMGGEMEGFGFIPSFANVPWVIVKTVSDFGCDVFDRDEQEKTAEVSVSLLSGVIDSICDSNNFQFDISQDDCLQLQDEMLGESFTIKRSETNSDTLNDILNDKYGPILHHKLKAYCSDLKYDGEFPYTVCDLLLEIVQNAFKHGGSSWMTLSFNQASIIVSGSNEAFDMTRILGENGGAAAWNHFKDLYISAGDITYSVKGKVHKITLRKIDSILRAIRIVQERCSAEIRPAAVRSSYAHDEGVLVFDPECREIYVDTSKIFMRSRAFSIIEDVKKKLLDGVVVYLSCRNAEEVRRYERAIADETGNLRTLVS